MTYSNNIVSSEIAGITGGSLYGPGDYPVKELLTDSRSAIIGKGVLFFALKGINHDGHDFIRQLVQRGVKSFVVSKLPDSIDEFTGCCFILVDDTLKALQKVAEAKRDLFEGSVIAVSGNTVKTIVRKGINDTVLIEDYYNPDPGSLVMAIDYLKRHQGKSHTLILSDFVTLGRNHRELAEEISVLLKRGSVTRFIGVGEGLSENADLFDANAVFFKSTDEFLASFHRLNFGDEAILLKGAPHFQFERIALLLEQKTHQTQLEINLDALSENLSIIRSMINPGVKIMAMVKAFAYGSGMSEIGSLFEYHRVDYLGVAYTDEGIELRDAGIALPVMVMNPDKHSHEKIIRYNLEPELYSFSTLAAFAEMASKHGLSDYPVHIKIDTGMHRLGFAPSETDNLIQFLKESRSIKVVSVFTHLAASESSQMDNRTNRQAEVFDSVCTKLAEGIGYMPLRHLLNSSGIMRFPQYQYEMVRPGISLYGLAGYKGIELRQVSRFVSRISQVRRVPAGEPVGYGFKDPADHDRIIATIPVGYADGLSRQLGNGKGALWIAGKRAPLVGNICMDMCMADVTGTDAGEDDQAEIFGENISVWEIAQLCDTITYEIITSIPPRVKRVFYRE